MQHYCTFDENGHNRTIGLGLRKAPGTVLPPITTPGFYYVLNATPYACADDMCTGPLAPILKKLLALRPESWKPVMDPAIIEAAKRRTAKGRRQLRPIPQPTASSQQASRAGLGNYCCLCGATGGCFSSVGDCRLLPVKQCSLGDCPC